MMELGYALRCLGEERVVLLFNEAHGALTDVPFDLRQHRILSYSCGDRDDVSALRVLTANLENQLRTILALPRRNDLDIRVLLQRGFAAQGRFSMRTVSVGVQNHSTVTLFLSSVMFAQSDGKFFYARDALNGFNTAQRIEAGDSYDLILPETAFREWSDTYPLVAAVAQDKIGRRWTSDPVAFARLLKQLRAE